MDENGRRYRWESLHNSDFKSLEFEGLKKLAGANAFTMSTKKWIDATQAIGIMRIFNEKVSNLV